MKTITKSFIVAAVAGLVLGLASCSKHTCPTYSKADTQKTEVKA